MTSPATPTSDLILARWAKRVLTYGATIVAVLSGALLFLFQTATKAALSPYGLDASGFSGSAGEMIMGGAGTLLAFSLVFFALYWPIGWPVTQVSGWISGRYVGRFGKPAKLSSLEAWITSDPDKQKPRAIMAGATVIVPLMAFLLFWSGSAIGQWRVSQAEWLVAANNCASGCFSYREEGRPAPVIGRPIAANATRMAVVVASGKVETVDVAKITVVEAYRGKPVVVPKDASWKLRWGWWLLDVLNANW